MKGLIGIVFFFLGAMGSLHAQHHHFAYIQADQQQPFYVKLGAEVLSSSAEGFLIIPKLKDSAYDMLIGFPEKKFSAYRFRFASFKKDRGFALKNFGEKGWGLFDYQTMDLQMGEPVEEKQLPPPAPAPVPLTNDGFTVILASVIDDPGLLATPLVYADAATSKMVHSTVVKDPLPAKKTVVIPEQKDLAAVPVGRPLPVATIEKEEAARDTGARPETERAPVLKMLQWQMTENSWMGLFADVDGHGAMDTVDVMIQAIQTGMPVADLSASVVVTQPADSLQIRSAERLQAKPADSFQAKSADSLQAKSADSLQAKSAGPVLIEEPVVKDLLKPNRSNCKRMAANRDVMAVRKKMVAIPDEDEMVAFALKDFKVRCYTAEQVRDICAVFTRDEGKYKLIDAAYPYVYDPANYPRLEYLLSDKYFIHRFKALINK